jgi:hypothetical protein
VLASLAKKERYILIPRIDPLPKTPLKHLDAQPHSPYSPQYPHTWYLDFGINKSLTYRYQHEPQPG